jgi:dipeptidyl-peptidase-4
MGAAMHAQDTPAQGRGKKKELTVERIGAQPSLSGALTEGLEWRPDGKSLSYLSPIAPGKNAALELAEMDAATGERRVVIEAGKLRELMTGEGEDRGQQTGLGRHPAPRYQWSPKGDALLFMSRMSFDWFDVKTQTSRRLLSSPAPISNVKISPDGRLVSFVREHDLWTCDIATGKVSRITTGGSEELLNGELDWVYPEELELGTAYWWSPDSSRVAFLEMNESAVTRYPIVDGLSYTAEFSVERYPKAGGANPMVRVGVVSAEGGEPRWMDTGANHDIYISRVAWLPDSKRLAVQRLNRAQNQLDLLISDVANGKSDLILTERDPFWINVEGDPEFLRGGKEFLWTSERDGFRHIYLYDASGRHVRRITRGDWQVTKIAGVNPEQEVVFFVATEKSPLERHLYRVALDGGDITRLTKTEGTHQISMAPGTRHYVDTWSSVASPPRQEVFDSAGSQTAVLNENRIPELAEYGLPAPEFGAVKGEGGVELRTMLIRPTDFDPARKYPVLVRIYGGPHAQMVVNAWGDSRFLWEQMMAQKGYIIFSLDNRGSWGRGHAFETPIYHRMGEVELEDQLAGINYLKSLPYVDGARIGIWGWSYGGYMTLNAMFRAPEVFKVGFAAAPVTDWRQYDTIYTERYMGQPQENPDGYRNCSPVNHAAGLRGKLLIAHGTGDDNVHWGNETELAEALVKAGRYAELLVYPGRGHRIADEEARVHLFHRVTQFFLDNL